MQIKRILTIASLILCLTVLSQCQYQLRGSNERELTHTRIALDNQQNQSPFIKTLRQNFRAVRLQLVPMDAADVVMRIIDHETWQQTQAVSANTQVRQHKVNFRVTYQLFNAAQQPITEVKQITVGRNFSTDDNQMLGASQEKWQIERELHQEVSYQLLNQLRTALAETSHEAHTG